MSRFLLGILLAASLSACSGESSDSGDAEGGISGPFPKTITGTIGYSYPVEDGSGDIHLGLLEYDSAAIIVSSETYDDQGMEEEEAEVSLTIEPFSSEHCGDAAQCFKGH